MARKSKSKSRKEKENLEILELQCRHEQAMAELRYQNEEAQRRHEEAQRRHEEAQRVHEEALRVHEQAIAQLHLELEKMKAGKFRKQGINIAPRKVTGGSNVSAISASAFFTEFWGRRKFVSKDKPPNYTDIAEDSPPAYR
jgi:ferric-dicitrate binding protein FerR (iron transport regulator)